MEKLEKKIRNLNKRNQEIEELTKRKKNGEYLKQE